MRQRTSYVHYGDAARRRARFRRCAVLVGLGLSAVAIRAAWTRDSSAAAATFGMHSGKQELRQQLEAARGELALANAQLERAKIVMAYSSRYRIAADLAGKIYDLSLAEGVDPELTFRVVRVESEFNPRAESSVGALGLMQLMLGTARDFDHSVTKARLLTPDVNLRLGLRYLRSLIEEHDGDVRMALLVYNRGPVAVNNARAAGEDPSNGYEALVTKGYHGTGLVE